MYDVASFRRNLGFNNYGNINPNHKYFSSIYSEWYKIISSANLAIHAAELPGISWASESEKAYMIAQARFFRAFAYRNLGELYGGVPLVTEIAAEPRYDYERASRIDTYKYAISELEAIENDLPETSSSGGRVVRGAAQHNLCELYLALGIQMEEEGSGDANAAYQKAVSYGNKVIDGGLYSLMISRFGTRANEDKIVFNVYKDGNIAEPVDTVMQVPNHYWDLFQEGNVNYQDGNTECVWSIQVDYDAYKAEDSQSKLGHTRNYAGVLRDGAPMHFTGLLEDIGGRGVVYINLTHYVRDQIYADKWGDDIRNSDAVFRRRFKANKSTSPYFKQIVPWSEMYYRGDDVTNMSNQSMCYPLSCKITTDRFTGLEDGENRSNLFRDDYYIRLSETILLRAEAKQRMGDLSGAAADVNMIRQRAQCSYMVTEADFDDSFDLILDERARELVYEENRWNTLLRMGGTIAVDRIKKYAFWPEASATLTFNYNLWPIPQSVIDSNKDIPLPQNPGWN